MNIWQFGMASVLTSSSLLAGLPVGAQLLPDGTLGDEASVVVPGAEVRGLPAELIEGGALRDSSLFHSFGEFNVDAGQRVYFASPENIENIFSRVTGRNPSNVFGTLGVDGPASLFLMNPNGVLFGPESSLDIEGSFFATTAERLEFGDGVSFSAVEPGPAPILQVAVPLGLQAGPAAKLIDSGVEEFAVAQAGFVPEGAGIESRGELRVGGDLGVLAEGLDLEGQVVAGGDLFLRGTDSVRIRDSVDEAFVGASRGALLLQGDEVVDIFALNNAGSGLVSGGDMVLRSAQRVGGDAHYFSRGGFRIEDLAGEAGSLFSPNDPVIFARGDINLNTYIGASLHIFAGGSINILTGIEITSADQFFGVVEDVRLSDGTVVEVRGNTERTVDIRAGIDPSFLAGEGELNAGNGAFSILPGQESGSVPSSSNINIGAINFQDINSQSASKVLVTNQYRPNPNLDNGMIRISAIPLLAPEARIAIQTNSNVRDGGDVFIDSRGGVQINGAILASSTVSNGGNIRVLAKEDIELNPTIFQSPLGDSNVGIQTTGLLGGEVTLKSDSDIPLRDTRIFSNSLNNSSGGKGGTITLDADSISLNENASLVASGDGTAEAGNINILADSEVQIVGGSSIESDTGLSPSGPVFSGGNSGGNIMIKANSLSLDDGTIAANSNNQGNSGRIDIRIDNDIDLKNRSTILNNIQAGSTGNGAGISIAANSLDIEGGSQINSAVAGATSGFPPAQGDGGKISVRLNEELKINGDKDSLQSGIFTSVQPEAIGNSGSIEIKAGSLKVSSNGLGAGIFTNNAGSGDAGSIDVDVDGLLDLSGTRASLSSVVNFGGMGNSGNIRVQANEISLTDLSGFFASNAGIGRGTAGNIFVRATENLFLNNLSSIQSVKGPDGVGNSGEIDVITSNLTIQEGGGIFTSSLNVGNAGDIRVTVDGDALIDGISIPTNLTGFGIVESSASGINSNVVPNLRISDFNDLLLDAAADFQNPAAGNSGNISFYARNLTLSNGGNINNSMGGRGETGNIAIEVEDELIIRGSNSRISSGIFSQVDRFGNAKAGSLEVKARNLEIENNGRISSANFGQGDAGNISIKVQEKLSATNSDILTSAQSIGGMVDITANLIRLDGDTDIQTVVLDGAGGDITLQASSILAFDDSDILTFAQQGQGGDIRFNTPAFFGENYIPGSLPPFENNDRVDINASGTIDGILSLPDVTFIQDSLTDLPESILNPDTLVANSCVVRSAQESQGQFLITGTGGLPTRPSDPPTATYTTGTIRSTDTSVAQTSDAGTNISAPIEPQGLYRLTNGRLVLSRECDQPPEPIAPS